MKKHWFLILYSTVLFLATILSVLATFVISFSFDGKINVGLIQKIDKEKGEVTWTDNSYQDDNITIVIDTIRRYDTTVYVADIKISKLGYLKTALAKNTYGRNIVEYPTVIAKRKEAILAINGDYYGFREKGLVIRNGILYDEERLPHDTNDLLVINQNGEFEIMKEVDADIIDLHNKGAWQAFTFGPGLVVNGEIAVGEKTEVGAYKASNPRTAIAYCGPLHYKMVVSNGRLEDEAGLTLYELAQVMHELGAISAYNLDGGGSSVMIFNNQIVNKPTSNGDVIHERRSSDIVYIGY